MTSTPTHHQSTHTEESPMEAVNESSSSPEEEQLMTPKEVTESELMPPPSSKEKKLPAKLSGICAQGEDEPMTENDSDKKIVTPSVVRTRQFRHVFPVSSPSDSLQSPCTQKLYPNKSKITANAHLPTAILREKQKLPNFAARLEEDSQMGNE